jgi:hypothetical protein
MKGKGDQGFTSVIVYQEQRILMIPFLWMSWTKVLLFLGLEVGADPDHLGSLED